METIKQFVFNDLPERFGRKRKYALGKTSGKANIEKIFKLD
jgi:D-citramalate synthase